MIWVKFIKPSKRAVSEAASLAGYRVARSGKNSQGVSVYIIEKQSENANFATLKTLLLNQGAFDASWL